MLKKLATIFKGFKRKSDSVADNNYQKKFGSYTAGYRHKE